MVCSVELDVVMGKAWWEGWAGVGNFVVVWLWWADCGGSLALVVWL